MTHAIILVVALLAGCASLEELARHQAEQARRQAAEDMKTCREIFGLASDDPQLVTCAQNQAFLRQWQVMQLRWLEGGRAMMPVGTPMGDHGRGIRLDRARNLVGRRRRTA
jgi:hypothetical protein